MPCASGCAAKASAPADVTTPVPSSTTVTPKSRRPVNPGPLKALVPRVRPYAGRLVVCAICLLIAASVGLAFPAIVQHLLDAAFQQHDRALLDRVASGR